MTLIFKILPRSLWENAVASGVFLGASIDLTDGYIHFSTDAQVQETAAKFFAGQDDLLLVAFDATVFGDALKWEQSRGGALFPHLYASLPTQSALWAKPLPLGSAGHHVFPDLIET